MKLISYDSHLHDIDGMASTTRTVIGSRYLRYDVTVTPIKTEEVMGLKCNSAVPSESWLCGCGLRFVVSSDHLLWRIIYIRVIYLMKMSERTRLCFDSNWSRYIVRALSLEIFMRVGIIRHCNRYCFIVLEPNGTIWNLLWLALYLQPPCMHVTCTICYSGAAVRPVGTSEYVFWKILEVRTFFQLKP